MSTRVRTGLYMDHLGRWRVVVEVNGLHTVADGWWPTESEAEAAAVDVANRVRDAAGMQPLGGGDA